MNSHYIKTLTKEYEDRVRRNPSLNIDSFIIPSPYAVDDAFRKDYSHSYVWEEERELLGYMETYADPSSSRFHIYKMVTSPFGRAKGIGSAFLAKLASETSPEASVNVFVWERQTEIVAFFKRRGFSEKEPIPWQALNFLRLEAKAAAIAEGVAQSGASSGIAEELGKVRHDAKKAIRLLADMAGALSAENCSRIIEDINRETTALVNTLNLFRDSVQRFRTVNLKDLIIDRIVPMVEHSPVHCELRLRFAPAVAEARAHYLDVARAIVNLVSNALDAIKAAGREGILSISLEQKGDWVSLAVEDNGVGISSDRLEPGPDGRPRFVGLTTKGESGEGQGTRQIYAVFGAENIAVHSEPGQGAKWIIRLPKAVQPEDERLRELKTRWDEYRSLTDLSKRSFTKIDLDRADVSAAIWRRRKLEILIWDLILQFARKNNVRDLYRSFLAYIHDRIGQNDFKRIVDDCGVDLAELRVWLISAASLLKREEAAETENAAPLADVRFKSYGQAVNRTVIFTLNPASGAFYVTDRKLAEHADFVPYLDTERDTLLRGEFFGDLKNPANPIQLGVWTIGAADDGRRKAALIRAGARRLLDMDIPPEKKLLFYESTRRLGGIDLDINRPRTLGTVAELRDHELGDLLVSADDDFVDFIGAD